mgnify:FL=1|jgi:hypothetical protein
MQILNRVKTQTHDIEHHDGKTYYRCSVCGRQLFRKIKSHGKVYCNKHYNQIKKYGTPQDTNPRTTYDKNEIIVDGKVARVKLYDAHCNHIATAIIDAEDVNKIRYTKWKLSASGYAANTPKFSGSNKHMHREILGTDQFVDHINHNTLDNRKSNLRIVTKAQNMMNSNFKGVSPNGCKWYAHIKINQKMLNLGNYLDEEEALYARWYAEQVLFKEFAYPKPEPEILESRKSQIQEYVGRKVQRL